MLQLVQYIYGHGVKEEEEGIGIKEYTDLGQDES